MDNTANDVFKRTGLDAPEISGAMYNAVIGLALGWGFWVNWWMVKNVPVESIRAVNPLLFFIGYFAACLLGVYLFNSSRNPAVSFQGYNLVVVPFGLVINLVVSRYDPGLVAQAMQITGGVTAGMMALGIMFHEFFKKIHFALTMALLLMIVVELVQYFVFHTSSGVTDWIVAAIFCGYIGYDWGRANNIPKTVDNAVDSAAALYMDIINLFLRILRILGRRK